MAIRIVRLGSDRTKGEGLRIGTARRPPRGVPKTEFAKRNFYDVWFPNLSPSAETMKMGKNAKTDKDWQAFMKKYRKEWHICTVCIRKKPAGIWVARKKSLKASSALAKHAASTEFS